MRNFSTEIARQALQELEGEKMILGYFQEGHRENTFLITTRDECVIPLRVESLEIKRQKYLRKYSNALTIIIPQKLTHPNRRREQLLIQDAKTEILTTIKFFTSMEFGHDV